MRFLGIDHGNVNIGIAISDLSNILARELITLKMSENIFDNISKICYENNITKIIIGLPISMRTGQDTDQTKIVRDFGNQIKEKLNMEIDFFDERLTSKIALNMPKAKRKGLSKDSFSAMLILQGYLDSK
jgi:putative holliday junction resolvase